MKLPKAWDSWRLIVATEDPKTRNRLIEVAIKLEAQASQRLAEAEAIKKEVRAIKEWMIQNFTNDELQEIKTKAGTAKLVLKILPTIEAADWPKLHAFIAKTGCFDLLQRRLHEGACKSRWESGETIPYVEKFIKKDIKFGESE